MAEPRRIQRQRRKGYRLPPDAIYVGRPTEWGNLVRATDCEACNIGEPNPHEHVPYGATGAVELFAAWAGSQPVTDFAPLRGHDLACWCRLCDAHKDGLPLGVVCPDCAPCHATLLLTLANR